MTSARKRLIGFLAAAIFVAAMSAIAVDRLGNALARGWLGVTYLPPPSGNVDPYSAFGIKPSSVALVMPGGPADRAGLLRGDQIVSINGIPLTEQRKIEQLDAHLRSGAPVVYLVRRGGATRQIAMRLESPLQTASVVVNIVSSSLVALIFLLIGSFVFARNPDDRRAVIFFAMTVVISAYFFSASTAQIDSANTRGIGSGTGASQSTLAAYVVIGITLFFAPLLLHLALIFPRNRPIVTEQPRIFRWIYGIPAVLAAFLMGAFALQYTVRNVSDATASRGIKLVALTVGIAAVIALVRIIFASKRRGFKAAMIEHAFSGIILAIGLDVGYMALSVSIAKHLQMKNVALILGGIGGALPFAALFFYPIATVIALYRGYRDSGVEERKQVQWPLWGTIVAVSGRLTLELIGTAVGLASIFGPASLMTAPVFITLDVVGKLLYLLIPISFAAAILKYRLMNIDIIIRRTVQYSILTAIVFVLYVALVGGVGTMLVKFAGVTSQSTVVVATIAVAIVAVPLRNKLQHLVDRNLFRERRDYPLALRNLTLEIGRIADLDAFLRLGAEQIQQALRSRFVILFLRHEQQYVAAAKVGLADDIVGRLRIDIDIDSAAVDESHPRLRALRTAYALPITAHREPLGLLAVGGKLSDQELEADDVDFLRSAASQIGVGIENARLRGEEEDFEQARAMQQFLLPKQLPQLDGYRIAGSWQPARSVGGDYFDVVPLGDDKVAICIADVAGKGMPAALLMANLQAAVKATASTSIAPAEICRKVMKVVADNLVGGKFISFFYGVLDGRSGRFAYTNAGHNPPIVVSAAGGVRRLTEGGPVFARLFRDDDYADAEITLHAGDRLVLFTDGVSEARRGEEEFGEDRLTDVIVAARHATAEELQAAIDEALTSFTAGNFGDDVTMVIVAA